MSTALSNPESTGVLVIGAGIMGVGIAQIAAQAGHPVMLFDSREDAAHKGLAQLAKTLNKLADKGKIAADQATSIIKKITVVSSLHEARDVSLVIEAIVENLEIKRALFAEIESLVSQDCILASNTSSISITRLARDLAHPGRMVGMHFFNPAPLMKLVEVVSGLKTSRTIAQAIAALAEQWGKVAVHTRSTPGFIVNRIARPYYAESLALLQEEACNPSQLDACLRAAGFRMGPCELMDLIGHDTNFAVTQSVYEGNFYDKRFMPSLVQRELVDGGLLGRKSGQGFYAYDMDGQSSAIAPEKVPESLPYQSLCVAGSGPIADHLDTALRQRGYEYVRDSSADWTGLEIDASRRLRLTDGRTASQLGKDVAVFDRPLDLTETGGALAMTVSIGASETWLAEAQEWLRVLGFAPVHMRDTPGLIVARTLAMLINEAADAVQQGICSQADADTAMRLGVSYPAGPFEWLSDWDTGSVATLLDTLDFYYRGERYRVSPWLRERAWMH